MKADDLVALAASGNIDIAQTVAAVTNTRGIARQRLQTREERLGQVPVRETVDGKQTRVVRPRRWSHADTGIVFGGCPRIPWLAACFSWAGDSTHFKELHRALTLEAIRTATREEWPLKTPMADGTEGYYLERLAELVLDFDRYQPVFSRAPGFFAIYLGVTQHRWSKPHFGHFLTLQQRYERWLAVAKGFGARRLRDEEEDVARA